MQIEFLIFHASLLFCPRPFVFLICMFKPSPLPPLVSAKLLKNIFLILIFCFISMFCSFRFFTSPAFHGQVKNNPVSCGSAGPNFHHADAVLMLSVFG